MNVTYETARDSITKINLMLSDLQLIAQMTGVPIAHAYQGLLRTLEDLENLIEED